MIAPLLSSLKIAYIALRTNKMRAMLTMLGVIIGVAAVIATVAVGAGATRTIQAQISSLGSNLIIVIPGSLTASGIRLGSGQALTLTQGDAEAIATQCPAVARAAPVVREGEQVIAGANNWATSILGITPDYLKVRDWTVAQGAPFTSKDVDSANTVALLGRTVVTNLFPSGNPVGQTIRISNVPLTVIGVLTSKGQSPGGQDQDDVVMIPLTTAKKRVLGVSSAGADAVGAIMVQATGPAAMQSAQQQMEVLLRQRHHLQPGQDDDFTIRNLEDVFAAQESSARVMAVLLAVIASVSLIVGGIGIMNIMLVSVTERTREIGLRQAVGAFTGDILLQFLVEAVALSVVGGVAGIGVGVLTAMLISRFAHWATVVSTGSIGLAFAFSALVGVFFGYYPARKAAYLDPIEALRYE
ncbi:MAG TPA: ABC transporter permease [Bryobacteraceae bacterium]|nr:ABC transporter permease [Bryobacteraceae bacterium]